MASQLSSLRRYSGQNRGARAKRSPSALGAARNNLAGHDAAKESNLPSRGLPGPASFEVSYLQDKSRKTRALILVGRKLQQVRIAEFGTRFGTRLRESTFRPRPATSSA